MPQSIVSFRPRRTARRFAVPAAVLAGVSLLVGAAAAPQAAAATRPAAITGVSSKPGPKPGQVVITWKTSGSHTTGYRVDTALTIFSRTDPRFPRQGRNFHRFTVRGSGQRSVTLTAADTRAAGAPVGSANHLYFRVYALNGRTERAYGKLQSVAVQPATASSAGTAIKVASFNVRTANAAGDTGSRRWNARAPYVARQIVAKRPGIVALQELSPGSLSGVSGTTRQTESLLQQLRANGGGDYALTRITSYAKPGSPMGSQGTRILYDRSRYTLKSNCREMTGSSHWNASCSFRLPLRSSDRETERRVAASVRFADRRTGKEFYFISIHLDARRSTKASTNNSYEALRGAQMRSVVAHAKAWNAHRAHPLPVIIAGDMNSWQNTAASYAPHNELVTAGWYDTAAARTRVNFRYGTMNKFATTLAPTPSGFGARLDVIAVKGGAGGAQRFENVMKATDAHRPSDHNMVVADFHLR